MNVKEALQVLETAAANGNPDVANILSSDYSHLRKTILTSAPHKAWESIKHAKDVTMDYTVDKAKMVDKSAHEHPWYFIGGAAVLAGVLGYLLGRNMK